MCLLLTAQEFKLRHYAGDVVYTVTGFVDKNNDLLFRDAKEVLSSSSNPLLAEVFPQEELQSRKRPPTVSAQAQFPSLWHVPSAAARERCALVNRAGTGGEAMVKLGIKMQPTNRSPLFNYTLGLP